MLKLFARPEQGHQPFSYRPDIDGLRGIAVLLVLIFHFDFFKIGKAGFIGVDIFFVISGYLISKIIWSGVDVEAFSFRQFYIRRIRRLAPPLFATLLVTFLVGAVVILPQELYSLAKESVAALIYVSNIYYWQTINYFGFQVEGSFLLHTWSLAVEEQFYLFFPILLVILHRFFPNCRASPILVLAIASFILNLIMVGLKPEATFYLLPTRAWELLAGAYLAAVEFRLPKAPWLKVAAGIGAVGLLVFALVTHNAITPFPGTFALLPVLAASMLLFAGSHKEGVFGQALAYSPLRWVGVISYSLYLVHWPVKTILPLLVFDYSLFWKIAGFLLSFVFATLMFVFVERPSKTTKVLRTGRRVVTGYTFTTAALLALFGAVIISDGWRDRFAPDVLVLADASEDINDSTRICTVANALSAQDCHLGNKDVRPTWVIVGDSHAQALSGAFDEWLTKRGEAGVLVFQYGCAPVYGVGDVDCQNFVKNARAIWQAPGIGNVFLVSIWRVGLEGGFRNDTGAFVEPQDAPAYVEGQFGRLLRDIRADGRKSYLWMPLPPSKKALPFNLARSEIFGLDWQLGLKRDAFTTEYQPVFQIFKSETGSLDGVVDPARTMCATGICLTTYNDKPIYSDNNHPAASQKSFFAKMLADQIDQGVK